MHQLECRCCQRTLLDQKCEQYGLCGCRSTERDLSICSSFFQSRRGYGASTVAGDQ